MNCKLFIFSIGLALTAAGSSVAKDLRGAFESKPAIYLPISDGEVHSLRLPRATTKRLTLTRRRPSLTFNLNDEAIMEPLSPPFVRYNNGRVARSVTPVLVTEDDYYDPVFSYEDENTEE